ncbi:MAG: hypothetical protein JNM00_04995 [Flavobacteriales bacterium]|nr:hypothetical protein [Flavobacteriales bacterium]
MDSIRKDISETQAQILALLLQFEKEHPSMAIEAVELNKVAVLASSGELMGVVVRVKSRNVEKK